MNAPPPVAITFGDPSISRAMTRRSPSRKVGLAEPLEYFCDGHSGRFLDFLIGVDEIEAQAARQPAADAGFADAHHPDQHDRPVDMWHGVRFHPPG